MYESNSNVPIKVLKCAGIFLQRLVKEKAVLTRDVKVMKRSILTVVSAETWQQCREFFKNPNRDLMLVLRAGCSRVCAPKIIFKT